MLVLGSPAASLAAGFQNEENAPPVKAGQQPTTEQEAAQKYKQGPGVFINRPLSQVSKAADALMDDLEGRGCDFFYNEVGAKSGLVRDRAPAVGLSLSRVASIAATGFGLTALCIAAKRNYLRASLCEQRVEQTLAFLLEQCPHEHGFLYHFIDINSGERVFGSELSSIDTSLLLCGVLTCRQFFSGNSRIEALATTFYRRIDWQWMLNGGTSLSMGWLPDQGFLKHRWDIYSELMTMYLMAIGSPTHPIPASTWDELQRPVVEYSGIQYISGVAPLFIHQYAHAWCDYRDKRDLHANYFTNSIAATRCHQLWCLVLGRKFPWIDQNLWGITASDSRNGYRVWGG
ncbi:MAG: glucoamylase family protein, partial [Acidobacteriaceae bacterium]